MKNTRAAPRRGTFIFGIVGDILGAGAKMLHAEEMQDDAQHFADTQGAVTRDFNASEAQKLRDWQTHMSNTQYQRAAKDLEAANINPILAYAKMQGGVPGGAAASAGAPSGGIAGVGEGPRISAAMQSASQIAVNDAVEERTRAEAKRAEAETREIEARTPTHAVNIEKMRQEIGESAARIERIWQEATHHASSAKHLDQQVVNLQATLPQIRATIKNLEAMTEQHKETTAEIRQRIQSNLPHLKAVLDQLEAKSRLIAQPGQYQQQDVRTSFVGLLGEYLRALLPLNNFINTGRPRE